MHVLDTRAQFMHIMQGASYNAISFITRTMARIYCTICMYKIFNTNSSTSNSYSYQHLNPVVGMIVIELIYCGEHAMSNTEQRQQRAYLTHANAVFLVRENCFIFTRVPGRCIVLSDLCVIKYSIKIMSDPNVIINRDNKIISLI